MHLPTKGDRLASFSLYVLGAVGVLTALVFLISGLVMKDGFERAWEVLLGIQGPFEQAPLLGVPLSALGFLLIPAVIGAAAADGIARYVDSQLDDLPDVETRVADRLEPKIKVAVKEEVAQQLTPDAPTKGSSAQK